MTMYRPRLALCFTGGKDSTLVLHLLLNRPDLLVTALHLDEQPATSPARPPPSIVLADDATAQQLPYQLAALVTFTPPNPSFLSHPVPAIQAAAAAMDLPHITAVVKGPDYAACYAAAIARLNVDVLVTGDMLDVCSGFMRRAAAAADVHMWCPLWGINRNLLWDLVLDTFKLEPVLTCVHVRKFVGTWTDDVALAGNESASTSSLSSLDDSEATEDEMSTSSGPDTIATGKKAIRSSSEEDPFASSSSDYYEEDADVSSLSTSSSSAASAAVQQRRINPRRTRAQQQQPAQAANSHADVDDEIAHSTDPAQPLMTRALAHAHLLVGSTLTRDVVNNWLRRAARMDGVDLAGEMGEYHTMVTNGALFKRGRVDLGAVATPPGKAGKVGKWDTSVDPSGEYVYLMTPRQPTVVPKV
ncbi:hypothetical protein BCR44DRAFT_44329 [Catenaria anguillulae PL171]|uniref:Diphthine--ammonia ligase n=1 Tax=Catenaria anguillulae PL171 TaxID=765915 RepID=A0A1Y2HG26_9FUNG|nr:hypothetical protein BCR44DRAFT_44329 [Catenaria anguillulae PL171]